LNWACKNFKSLT